MGARLAATCGIVACMSSDAPMSAGEIADHITKMKRAVSEAEDRLNRLQMELEWWETGQKLFGDAPTNVVAEELPLDTDAVESSNGTMPSLRDRIATVLGQEPRKTWKTEKVIEELKRRDWLPGGEYGEHHVRSMLAKMHRRGEARRQGRGMYRLPPEKQGRVLRVIS